VSDPFRLETPEAVSVHYALAGVGSRFLAAAVDTLIQTVLLILVVIATSAAGGWAVMSGALRDLGDAPAANPAVWLVALFLIGTFLLLWGYYVAFELLWNGQSPGKRLFRLRVLRENGYPIGFVESLVRNLVRLLDFLPFYYGIGVVTMLIDSRSRRLGDLAAGTIVVKERRDVSAADLLPRAPVAVDVSTATLPRVERLDDRAFALVREYLLRRDQLGAPARAALARELCQALAPQLDVPPPDDPAAAEQFLDQLAAAYRARHAGRGGPPASSGPA
jgi:uncharacterized RDD family membrane protein YckC